MEKLRINKYLASKGVASRREIDKMIENGRIRVNGRQPMPGERVSDKDEIIIDGEPLNKQEEKAYFMLNKPSGVISSAKDNRGRKTVVDLVDTKSRIYPVGRLDYDTEGLILLTNDGELFNRVIHPRAKVYKTYTARLSGKIGKENLARLRSGVNLEDGVTLPAKVELLQYEGNSSWVEIAIREGRNRQIRRMCKEVGHPVLYLRREKIGGLGLGDLKIGEYRNLTKEEVTYLKEL